MTKTIKYFQSREWGQDRHYIHPDNFGDGKIISQLTGMKTISSAQRELIRDLTEGQIQFVEVIAPRK